MVGNLRELIPAFFVGPNGEQLSADEIARRRQVAGSLLEQATDTSPTAGGGASILAKAIQGLSYGINEGRADRAAAANAETSRANIQAMVDGASGEPSASAFPPAPSANVAAALAGGAPDVASARGAPAHGAGAPSTPVNISGSQQAFIDALLPAAIEESKRTGVDPRIIVAQSAQETGWGRSAPGNNYFGIKSHGKAGGQTLGTHEYVNGKRVNIRDSFRTFESPADSVRGYGDFLLANPRYKPLMAAQGLDAQLEALQASGYATDPNYSRSVGAIARGIQLPSASNAVAANEALAAGQMQGGLTPAALNSWASQNYNPAASIDRIAATGGAATPSTIGEADAREILAARPADASAYVGPGQLIAPSDIPGIMAPRDEGVIVAESPEDIAAAELAMNDPAFAGPAVSEIAPAVAPAPAPVVAPQVAQALTALPVNEALPMAGGVDNPRPIVPTAPQNPMQGLNPAVVQALSNPNATAQERSVAQALLQQHVAQNQALQAQAQEAQQRAEMLTQRRGLAGRMGIDPNYAVDDTIWKAATEANFRDPASYSAGSYIRNSDGSLEQVPLNPTGDIQEYEYYERREREAGRVPLGPMEYERELRRSGAITVDTGTIPQGYQAVRDDNGRIVRYEPIPGGPADTSSSDALKESSALTATDVVTRAAQRARDALNAPGLPSTGLAGRALANIPESNAAELRRQVEVLKSNAKVENLNAMRAASPTGGALGSVTEKEAEMLAAKSGSLDPDSPNILRDLNDYERTMLRIVHGREEGDKIYKELYGDDKGEPSADGWTTLPNGVKIRPKGAN